MKIYIVGAVTGIEDWEEKFIAHKRKLKRRGHEVRTPVDYPYGKTQKEYMVLSCESVFWADQIEVTENWENSKGTRAEIALAECFDLPIIYL